MDRRGCRDAGQSQRRQVEKENSLQADVWGQLEGVFLYVELLDLPRLPCMDSSCYLKGPGVPLLSRTGLQEVLSGSSGLQFNEKLWEETTRQTDTQRRTRQGNAGSRNDRAREGSPEVMYPAMPGAQPCPHSAGGAVQIDWDTSEIRDKELMAPESSLSLLHGLMQSASQHCDSDSSLQTHSLTSYHKPSPKRGIPVLCGQMEPDTKRSSAARSARLSQEPQGAAASPKTLPATLEDCQQSPFRPCLRFKHRQATHLFFM